MRSNVTASVLAAMGAAPHRADGRALAVATLVSWLIAEILGVWMLSRWIASGGLRQRRARPDGVPRSVIFGHAGLAITGFACWVSFLVTTSAVLAWLAIGFLALAIGFGTATVTVSTPYPASQERPSQDLADAGPADRSTGSDASAVPDHARSDDAPGGMLTDEMLARALADEALTSRLVDDLLARMLASRPPTARGLTWDLAPLTPAAHGVMAIVTFLLATLSAIAAT